MYGGNVGSLSSRQEYIFCPFFSFFEKKNPRLLFFSWKVEKDPTYPTHPTLSYFIHIKYSKKGM
jgi:hypothetical protein